eukprot:8469740-Pyramimonas_sp.AAC.1
MASATRGAFKLFGFRGACRRKRRGSSASRGAEGEYILGDWILTTGAQQRCEFQLDALLPQRTFQGNLIYYL